MVSLAIVATSSIGRMVRLPCDADERDRGEMRSIVRFDPCPFARRLGNSERIVMARTEEDGWMLGPAASAGSAATRSAPGAASASSPISRRWVKPVTAFVAVFAGVWLALFAVHRLFPLLRTGEMIVLEAKYDRLARVPMFEPHHRYRLMVFGHSRALSGVQPHRLDAALGDHVRTFNLGLPARTAILPILEAAIAAGNVPTHILLTLPWDDEQHEQGLLDMLRDDPAIVNTLFPFRTLTRDAFSFVSRNFRDLGAGMRDAQQQRDTMVEQRGWYFIKQQSRFPDHRLPDDFRLPTDHPDKPETRIVPEASVTRERLRRLALQHGFEIVFIPADRRAGHMAPRPPEEQERDLTIAERPRIRLVGPDYWIYPPAHFSDPLHLNPAGAEVYTDDLARLLRKHRIVD